ncbi:MAG: CARDB domain-containing protein [Pirellulales bacterium]
MSCPRNVVLAGLVVALATASGAMAQSKSSSGSGQGSTLADRLERFRRNLIGGRDESPTQHRRAHSAKRSHSKAAPSRKRQGTPTIARPRVARANDATTRAAAPSRAQTRGHQPHGKQHARPHSVATSRDSSKGLSAFQPARQAKPRTAAPPPLPPATVPATPLMGRSVEASTGMHPNSTSPGGERAGRKPTSGHRVASRPLREERSAVRRQRSPSADFGQAALTDGDRLTTGAQTGLRDRTNRAGPSSTSRLLFTQSAPHLTTQVRGPKSMVVGHSAEFRVSVANEGGAVANRVEVRVVLPDWATLVGSTSSSGATELKTVKGDTSTLIWSLSRLDVHAMQSVDLEIIPRRGQRLKLAVSSRCAPPASQAVIEVQEPKLKIVVAGPAEALFGETKQYTFTVSNPGTGPAEDVVIHLLRVGSGDKVADVHKVGTLLPGASRQVDVDLTARKTGTVLVKARATASGNLLAEVTQEVLVRRPGLRVDLSGPQTLYAGAMARYELKVTNPGTASAEDIALTASLPEGAKLVDSGRESQVGDGSSKVTWQVASLDPKESKTFHIHCLLNTPGKNELEVFSEAHGGLTDASTVVSDVIAVADLTLRLNDPTGPVQVGEEAIYEIVVRNRGTKRAEAIDVVTFFSEGIEPIRADGNPYEMASGQVAFHTIDGLDAGQQMVLTIRAKAVRPGTHKCRTEVACPSVDVKLAVEETTRFYGQQIARGSSEKSQRPLRAADARAAERAPTHLR